MNAVMTEPARPRQPGSDPVDGQRGTLGAGVRFDRVEKQFRGSSAAAVDGVSLEIAPGEFLTMLGPSGSGKTTTLMMLAGFETPSAGEIFVDGRPVAAVPPWQRNIGMVFQSYALFPHMTVGENIAFPLKLRRLDRADIARETQQVLELVGLPGYEGRYPRQLSGGQQQRVALARALVFDPRVLLMDEPLGALDKQLRERLQLEIKALHGQLGVTIVYVTHDQQEALVMSDRIAVMNHGRIEQVGTPTEIYDEPATRFVASFIGESNFLAGCVVEVDGGVAAIDVPGVGLLRARGNGHRVGAAAELTVRPEKIVFADELGDGPANRIEAAIASVVFVGDAWRYEARLSDGQSIVLKRQHRAGVARQGPGDAARLAWSVDDGRLVASGEG